MEKHKKTPDMKIPRNDAEIICRDFMTFCNYLVEHKIKISKTTGHMGKKDCFELNKLFYWREEYEKATQFQTNYPLIHFFYYVALKHRILEFNLAGNGMIYGKNYTLYQNAPVMEQYTLLLLNFLYDADYMEFDSAPLHITPFFYWVDEVKPKEGKRYLIPYQVLREGYTHKSGVPACLEEFRLISIDKKNLEKCREEFIPLEIIVQPALKAVSYLFETMAVREEELWNEEKTDKFCFEKYMDILDPTEKEYVLSGFFMPESITIPEQTIDLKVSMRYHDCSRTIRMNLSNSLYELHMMIQIAFDFDNDHLFEFYVGRKPFQRTFTSEYGVTSGDEYSAEETALGELELRKGQDFSYFFDFGDRWWFEIKVEKIADGTVSEPQIIKSENDAPEQYPMWEDDWHDGEDYDEEGYDYKEEFEECESIIESDISVASILASIEDELIEDQYAVLFRTKDGNDDALSPDEKRKKMEETICQEPDKMLAFITEEMSEILTRLVNHDDFNLSELCEIAKLYSFGFCTFPEKDGWEILVPKCIQEIYAPKLERKEKLPDQFTEISELLLERCGVIEMETLYFTARTILKRRIDYEEYTFFIFSRLHYFGEYFVDSFAGTEYISRYDRELTESILEERQKPKNSKYHYPDFGKIKMKELKEPAKELEDWKNYIHFHLSIDPEPAFWLINQIPLLASTGIIEAEEIIDIYKKVVNSVGSRMTKKVPEMIRELCNSLPLAIRFGNAISDEAKEEYQQLSLFD